MAEPISTALGVGLVGGLAWRKIKRHNKAEDRADETFRRQREIDDRAEGQKRLKNFLMHMVNGRDISPMAQSDAYLRPLLNSQGYGRVSMSTPKDHTAGVAPGSIWFHPTEERIAQGEGPLALSREQQSRLLVDLGFTPQVVQMGQMAVGPGGISSGGVNLNHSVKLWGDGKSTELPKSQIGRYEATGTGLFDTTEGTHHVVESMRDLSEKEVAAKNRSGGSSGQNFDRASDNIRKTIKTDPVRLGSKNRLQHTLADYGAEAQRILAGIAEDIGYENPRLQGMGSRLGAAAMSGYGAEDGGVSFEIAFDEWRDYVVGRTKTVGQAVRPTGGVGLDTPDAPPTDLSVYQGILDSVLNKVKAVTAY